MPPAARVGDPTTHTPPQPSTGVITGPGVASVTIGGVPAAVQGDLQTCGFPAISPPWVDGPYPLPQGSTSVRIGGRAALRQGDTAGCGAVISAGSASVSIGG